MLFNSIDFVLFLPVVFILYWFVFHRNQKQQNFLVVVASYVFYGWWDWRFLGLILFSTLVDFSIARLLKNQDNESKRRLLLFASLAVNLGLLGFFKYYNFFLDNFVEAFRLGGHELDPRRLNIILPVGISFYTFQTLSYTIDVYRRKLEASTDLPAFMAYVSFFPQLVAGPIERATHLLPQFSSVRKFDYGKAVDGLRQVLWGFFKKVVIADNCAELANQIFNNADQMNSSALILGAFFFTFQIYGDFSGYSDIAIGVSRLFGFDLMRNFAFPYFSRDIAEFWRKWHISLSTWFRDYLYIPLGGSKGSQFSKIRNIMIIFLVSGFWHGANWTFIAWGFLNAVYFLPLLLTNRNRKNLETVAEQSSLPSIREFFQMLATFSLTVFAWIFFRAESMSHAFSYIKGIVVRSPFQGPNIEITDALGPILLIGSMLMVEWAGRREQYALAKLGLKWPSLMRYGFYYLLLFAILYLGVEGEEFIYFQF